MANVSVCVLLSSLLSNLINLAKFCYVKFFFCCCFYFCRGMNLSSGRRSTF